MIENYKDYKLFIKQDAIACRRLSSHSRIFGDEVWKFQKILRETEYLHNCHGFVRFLTRWLYAFEKIKYHKYSIRLGVLIKCI